MIEIIQGFDGKYDRLVPIMLGKWFRTTPTVYFADLPSTEKAYYRLYCFFHYKDWSAVGGLIGRLDSHDFDFEGALKITPRQQFYNRHGDRLDRPFGWITVNHSELKFYRTFSEMVSIDSQGHGVQMRIRPPRGDSYIHYHWVVFDLVDMLEPRRLAWFRNKVQPVFNRNKVNMPWEWNDWLIRRKRGKKTDGLIWNDPHQLIIEAIKTHKIRRKDWADVLSD